MSDEKMKNEKQPVKCAGPVVGLYTEADIENAETEEGKKLARQRLGFKKREYCGYDVTEIIAKIPYDSEKKKFGCPKCNNVISVTNVAYADLPHKATKGK